jgi:hypothetical protein
MCVQDEWDRVLDLVQSVWPKLAKRQDKKASLCRDSGAGSTGVPGVRGRGHWAGEAWRAAFFDLEMLRNKVVEMERVEELLKSEALSGSGSGDEQGVTDGANANAGAPDGGKVDGGKVAEGGGEGADGGKEMRAGGKDAIDMKRALEIALGQLSR